MSPSIFISCTSATPAAGLDMETSLTAFLAVKVMNAPVACCPGTLVRTQASLTSTPEFCEKTGLASIPTANAAINFVVIIDFKMGFQKM
jgi:hypothetical protein